MRALIYLTLPFLLITSYAGAQGVTIDTTRQDTVNRFVPTGIRFGVDAVSYVRTRSLDSFNGWEITGDIDFYRYLLTVDYGAWSRNFGEDSTSYQNDGRYWRVGIDANFLTRDPERNVFFIGARYGRSSYSESMTIIREDAYWGNTNQTYNNQDLTANWLELTGGLKVKIWKLLWMGYTARFKFRLNENEAAEMRSHDIPGYGTNNKPSTWGFNYYIMLRIPFRKAGSILPPEK